MRKTRRFIAIVLIYFIIFAPLLQLIFAAFTPQKELSDTIMQMENGIVRYASPFSPPIPPTFSGHRALFQANSLFLRQMLNSFAYAAIITILQLIVSLPLGFLFAKIRFRFREPLFFIMIVCMVMPFQIMLLPNYMIFRAVGLLDNPIALILPGIFSPLGVFLFRQYISQIDTEILEMAQIEGASWFRIILRIICPLTRTGIMVFVLLCFTRFYSSVDSALAFLDSAANMPLSVVLRTTYAGSKGLMFAQSFWYALPPIGIYLLFLGNRRVE